MTFASEGRDELVHDTTRDPCEVVLGLLAEQRFLDGIKSRARDRFEQCRGADFESGAAAQAATQRHGGMKKHVETSWLDAERLKTGDDAPRVISPFRHAWYDGSGKINRYRIGLQGAAQRNDLTAIHRTVSRHHTVKLDSHR